jgi:hypothetical protein
MPTPPISVQDMQHKMLAHLRDADALCINIVEVMARKVLQRNSTLDEFVCAMGSWCFTRKADGEPLERDDLPVSAHALRDFIDEWDGAMKITGWGVRFKATSPIVTGWGTPELNAIMRRIYEASY